MGCFLACFGSSKDKKRGHCRSNRVPFGVVDQRRGNDAPAKQDFCAGESLETAERAVLGDEMKLLARAGPLNEGKLASPTGLISVFQNRDNGVDELKDEIREPGEEAATKKGQLAFPSSSDSRRVKNSVDNSSSGTNTRVVFDLASKSHEPLATCDVLEKEDFSGQEKTKSIAEPSTQNLASEAGPSRLCFVSYPPKNRYQNCRESDDEELDYEESDMDVCEDELEEVEFSDREVLSDSLCSTKSSTRISSGDGISPDVNFRSNNVEVTVCIRGRDDYYQSMLNPVENLSQWNSLKSRVKPPLLARKESSALEQEMPFGSYISNPCFKQAASLNSVATHEEQHNQPMAVDASLSNWLTVTETRPFPSVGPKQTVSQSSFSPINLEDRPILGALTVEELKLMSRTSSPRSSPTKTPDDMVIIGTVGSYWSCEGTDKESGLVSSYKGIPNTTSKYREDMTVNWHSTPFETRLERALNRGSAGA